MKNKIGTNLIFKKYSKRKWIKLLFLNIFKMEFGFFNLKNNL